MNVNTCNQCGKLFMLKNEGEVLCPKCQKKEKKFYFSIDKCLKEHPNITVEQLSEKTDSSPKKIIKKIRNRRISVKNSVRCERCGDIIDTGRFCEKCRQELIVGFNSPFDEKENENSKGALA
jgi:uncharacterized Zn finger protein (UPF0148 family)